MIFLYCIQESDKPNKILKAFSIVKIEDNKIILPIAKGENVTEKQAEKLASKTKSIIGKLNSNSVLLSKNVKKQEQYMNYLNSYNLNIIEGKWLYGILANEILDYIINKKNIKKEETQISITINEVTEVMLDLIKHIAKEYKRVNIVTNHIEKFKKIEEQLLEQEGLMVTVSNNKRKGLAKSQIIINADFPEELINEYQIFDEAIIINLKGKMKINKKRFKGININNYEITYQNNLGFFEDVDLQNKYEKKDIYEAQIYKKQPIENIRRKLEQDKVQIVQLQGFNTTL